MTTVGKRLHAYISICIATLFLGIPGFLPVPASAAGSGTFPYSGEGNWVISNETIIENENITLNGDLIIENGGDLTLINTTLIFNCSYDGQFGIIVKDGGNFDATGSRTVREGGTGKPSFPFMLFLGCSGGSIKIFENKGTLEAHLWEYQGLAHDENETEIEVGYSTKPTFADLDADGDQDLCIGTTDGVIIYFENTGSQADPVWRKRDGFFPTEKYGGNSSPTFADLDDDGDLDCVVGTYVGTFCYLENTGTSLVPQWRVDWDLFTGIDLGFMTTPTLADIDGDGDLDMSSGEYSGALYHFENTGTPDVPSWTQDTEMFQNIDEIRNCKPEYFDVDFDGDLDMTIGENGGGLIFMENTGTEFIPEWSIDHNPFANVENGYVSAPGFYIQGSHQTLKSTLTPTGVTDDMTPTSHSGGSSNSARSYDSGGSYGSSRSYGSDRSYGSSLSHGSGRSPESDFSAPDLVIGSFNEDFTVYEHIGTRNETLWRLDINHLSGLDLGSRISPEFGDLDGDGDLDLLVGRRGGNNHGTILFMENFGTPSQPEWVEGDNLITSSGTTITISLYASPELGDLDNDGDLDLTIGSYNGALQYYENIGDESNAEWKLDPSQYNGMSGEFYSTPSLVDIDGDQDLDLVVGSISGELTFYRNTGSAEVPTWTKDTTIFSTIPAISGSAPEFADMDGDGDQDLVIGNNAGVVELFTNIGDVGNPLWRKDGEMKDRFGDVVKVSSYALPALADVINTNYGEQGEDEIIWHDEIRSDTEYRYSIRAEKGAGFSLRNMSISMCGSELLNKEGMLIRADNVTISGCQFDRDHTGILLDSAQGALIENNTFSLNTVGISVLGGSDHTITTNTISGSTSGISLENTSGISLDQNSIENVTLAYSMKGTSGITINGSSISLSGTGLSIEDSTGNTIAMTDILNCDSGIILSGSTDHSLLNVTFVGSGLSISGDSLNDFSSHTIVNGTVNSLPLAYYSGVSDLIISGGVGQLIITDCSNVTVNGLDISSTDTGILSAHSTHIEGTELFITNCTTGISVVATNNLSIHSSRITKNGIGIRCDSSPSTADVNIHGNTIMENTHNGVQVDGTISDPINADWNFWGSDSGPSHTILNPGGQGDPVSDHIDFHPWLRAEPGRNIWIVDPDAPAGGIGTEASPFAMIQDAIDLASDGDSIFLRPGIYRERVIVDRSVEIYGPDGSAGGVGSQAILDAMGGIGITFTCDSVLTNLTITNASLDMDIGSGESSIEVYNTTFSTQNISNGSSLSVGYFLDVLLRDKSGTPVPDSFIVIENGKGYSRMFLSGSTGMISSIPLVEYHMGQDGSTEQNPYFLNATGSIGHANVSISIHRNLGIVLNLSRHGGFGDALAIGDIDGNGYQDYVIGAPDDCLGGWKAGAVFVFFGSQEFSFKDLSVANADLVIEGEKSNDRFGSSITIDDINTDGKNDLIVTAPGSSGSQARIFVFSGRMMTNRTWTLKDAMILTPPDELPGHKITDLIETADIDADGFQDILIGYSGGIMVFHGQSMIDHEDFSSEPILSDQWDPIIQGNGGEMRIENELVIDTEWNINQYAYAMSADPIITGIAFTISIRNGNGADAVAILDYKVPENEVNNQARQDEHTLLRLMDSGILYYKSSPDQTYTITSLGTEGIYTEFTFILSNELTRLVILKNGIPSKDIEISGWSDLYIRLGDSITGNRATVKVKSFKPLFTTSILPGLSQGVKVTLEGEDHLAVVVDGHIRLMPLDGTAVLQKHYSSGDHFSGTFNHTLFDSGITINPLIDFSLVQNGDFDDGWDNWSFVENEQGNLSAGKRAIIDTTYMDWFTHVGPTAAFGANKDFLTGEQADSEGRLRSENFTIPQNATYLSFWYRLKGVAFDLDQPGYPDSIKYLLRNASSDERSITLVEYIPPAQNSYKQESDILLIDISSLRGQTVYLSIDIITDSDVMELALAEIDEISGVEVYTGNSGEFISDLEDLQDEYATFIPTWEGEENGGNISLYFRTNESSEWVSMEHGTHNWLNGSSFQYRVLIENANGEPYPVFRSLACTWYRFDATDFGKGTAHDAGPVYDVSTLAVVDSNTATFYRDRDPWFTISSDHPITGLSGVGDVNGDDTSDIFVSSNETVHLVLMPGGPGNMELGDSDHDFSGPTGFGTTLDQYVVGSPLENENDGRAYLLPSYLEDCSILGADLENHSFLFPGDSISINVSLINMGLNDTSFLDVIMEIRSDGGYEHDDAQVVSLDSWESMVVSFNWTVPTEEGILYTIAIILPQDQNNANNIRIIDVRSRYHALEMTVSSLYDSVSPGSHADFDLTITNLGTYGTDSITIDCISPQNWTSVVTHNGTQVSTYDLEGGVELHLDIHANGTRGEYEIMIRVTSENGVTIEELLLTVYVIEIDITPVRIIILRSDGKETQPVAGEETELLIEVANIGIQDAGTFDASLILDSDTYPLIDIGQINAGENLTIVHRITLTEGDHTLTLILDPDDDVKEYDEKNNAMAIDISVLPEYTTSPYIFNVTLFDTYGDPIIGATVTSTYFDSVITNVTNNTGYAEILITEMYKEGNNFTLEAYVGDLYGAKEVRVYSSDTSSDVVLVAGLYSVTMECNCGHQDILPGGNLTYRVDVSNIGDFNDRYSVSIMNMPSFWSYTISGPAFSEGTLTIAKGTQETLMISITAWTYTPAFETHSLIVVAESTLVPVSDKELSIHMTVLLVENTTISTESTTESGLPGDPIAYRFTLRNEGNIHRNITLFLDGNVDHAELNQDRIALVPGSSVECWLTVRIPNLRAGTILKTQVFGVIHEVGTTDVLEFSTTIERDQRISRLAVTIIDWDLRIENLGNDLETLEIETESEVATISPAQTEITLDMGEWTEIPLDADLHDLSVMAHEPVGVAIRLYNGEIWHNSTVWQEAPAVHGISFSPMPQVITVLPGAMAEISAIVENTGNTNEDIMFSGMNSGSEHLQLPPSINLAPGQSSVVLVRASIPEHAFGSRSIVLTAITTTAPVTSDETTISLLIHANRSLELKQISVRMSGSDAVYTVNLLNTGQISEEVLVTSTVGDVEMTSMIIEPSGMIQFHLTVPLQCDCPGMIDLRAELTSNDSIFASLPLTPPPRPEIQVVVQGPYHAFVPISFTSPGDYRMYDWSFDGSTLSGQEVQYQFEESGSHSIRLTVTDERNLSAWTELIFEIENLPPSIITPPLIAGVVGDYLMFDALGSHDPDGRLVDLTWNIENETYHGMRVYHVFQTDGLLTVTLTGTDNQGATNSTTIQVSIRRSNTPSTVGSDEIDWTIAGPLLLILLGVIVIFLVLFMKIHDQEHQLLTKLSELEGRKNTEALNPTEPEEPLIEAEPPIPLHSISSEGSPDVHVNMKQNESESNVPQTQETNGMPETDGTGKQNEPESKESDDPEPPRATDPSIEATQSKEVVE